MPPKMLKDEQLRKSLLPKVHDPDSVLIQKSEEAVVFKVDNCRKQVRYGLSFHLGAAWPLLSSTLGVIPPEITNRRWHI